MGSNERCSWDDPKRELNIRNHGYDFGDLRDAFDGRFCLTRIDDRKDHGEDRYNMLVEHRGRIVNITFTPRNAHSHLISARPASREERKVYHAKAPKG